jgi:hypothetical protein
VISVEDPKLDFIMLEERGYLYFERTLDERPMLQYRFPVVAGYAKKFAGDSDKTSK